MEMKEDSNVGVGVVFRGVVTPTDTANHELASQALPKLRIVALVFKAAYRFMEAKDGWELNKTNTTEEATATRYDCGCHHVVTVDVEIKCPFCQGGFIQPCEGVNPPFQVMPSESELSEIGSDGERTIANSSEWILLLTNLGLEILSAAFDQVFSPSKPHYALIGMLLAIVAILTCIWELVHNGIKERVVLRRRGQLWCFYYPPPSNMLFGTFPQILGLGLAIVQCICSVVQYYYLRRHATNPIKLSPVPVVFFFSLVVFKLVKNHRYTVDDTVQNGA